MSRDCFGFIRHKFTNTIIEPGQDQEEDAESVIDYYDDDEVFENDDYDWFLHPIDGYEEPKELEELTNREILKPKEISEIISAGKNLMQGFSLFDGKFINKPTDFTKHIAKFNVFNDVFEMQHDFRDKQLFSMVGSQFKQQIIKAMEEGRFTMSLGLISDEDDFLKHQIQKIIKPELDRTVSIKQALKLTDHNIALMIKIFRAGYEKFQTIDFLNGQQLPFKAESFSDDELKDLFMFQDKQAVIRFAILKKIRIVYSPSGGGKTNLAKKYDSLFYDVDQLVQDHYQLFEKVKKLAEKHKKYKGLIMQQFFKYCIYKTDYEILTGKILLLNHPNQVPNCFKYRKNELIILPYQLNWRVRFFSENFFSLLFVDGYVKRFSHYSQYKNLIVDFFKIKKKAREQLGNNQLNSPTYQPEEPPISNNNN